MLECRVALAVPEGEPGVLAGDYVLDDELVLLCRGPVLEGLRVIQGELAQALRGLFLGSDVKLELLLPALLHVVEDGPGSFTLFRGVPIESRPGKLLLGLVLLLEVLCRLESDNPAALLLYLVGPGVGRHDHFRHLGRHGLTGRFPELIGRHPGGYLEFVLTKDVDITEVIGQFHHIGIPGRSHEDFFCEIVVPVGYGALEKLRVHGLLDLLALRLLLLDILEGHDRILLDDLLGKAVSLSLLDKGYDVGLGDHASFDEVRRWNGWRKRRVGDIYGIEGVSGEIVDSTRGGGTGEG